MEMGPEDDPMSKTDEFPITRVTPRFHRLVKALEKAVLNFHKVSSHEDADIHERTEAWSHICVARECLYQYAESLECRTVSIDRKRTIQLRF